VFFVFAGFPKEKDGTKKGMGVMVAKLRMHA